MNYHCKRKVWLKSFLILVAIASCRMTIGSACSSSKLFDAIYAPLTLGLLRPYPEIANSLRNVSANSIGCIKLRQPSSDDLVNAVGLKVAPNRHRDRGGGSFHEGSGLYRAARKQVEKLLVSG
jgi:hypothetical protein